MNSDNNTGIAPSKHNFDINIIWAAKNNAVESVIRLKLTIRYAM
jgi:hypothetical protein